MKKILILTIVIVLVSVFSFGETFTGKCVAISDGDTAKVLKEGKAVKVRFWGIDTPEKKQAYGTKAKEFTSSLIFGKVVKVVVMDTDRYGRFVGKIYKGDLYVNLEIVKAGFAWHYVRYAKDAKDLADAEKEARKEKLGLWKDPEPIPPWDWRRGVRSGQESKAEPEAEYVYVTRTGQRYHLHDCEYLKGSVMKMKLEDAKKRGYKPCSRCKPPG